MRARHTRPSAGRNRKKTAALLGLYLTAPLLMGGCPEFRDEAVNAIESATEGIVLAALDLFFDQFRGDSGTTRF